MELFPNRIALGLQGVGFTSSVLANAASMKFVSAPLSARVLTLCPSTIDQIVKWVLECLALDMSQKVVSFKPQVPQSQVCCIECSEDCMLMNDGWEEVQNASIASIISSVHMVQFFISVGALSPEAAALVLEAKFL